LNLITIRSSVLSRTSAEISVKPNRDFDSSVLKSLTALLTQSSSILL
jgi:hypothetical protein